LNNYSFEGVTAAISPSHDELLWFAYDIADNIIMITEEELSMFK